jgi:hypothetical protein
MGGPVRFASWGAGLVLLGLGGKAYLSQPHEDSPETILGIARSKGLVPLKEHPRVGTEIYQWDSEIPEVAPYHIGPVVKTDVKARLRSLTAVQQTKFNRLLIEIKPGEMRYWVLK